MTLVGWAQIALFCAVVIALVKPLGWYMTSVFSGERTFLSPVIRPIESSLYKLAGVNERSEQDWLSYALSLLLFNVGGFLILYTLLRTQGWLPFNPQGMTAVAPDLSFNTAVSFVTNTNWQNYGGETTLSYLTQMLGPDASELPVGRHRYRHRHRAHPRFRTRLDAQHRQLLGRYHALHALHPAADLHSA